MLGIKDLMLSFSVSATTRSRRNHEVDGKDYHFISTETFREKIAADEFLEWEEVYEGQYYGTLTSEIEKIWSQGHHVVFDLDVLGGLNLKKIFGDRSLSIFVKPPSIEALRFRLRNRSTETAEKISMRIEKAQHELTYEPLFDTVIVNDVLDDAFIQAENKVREFLAS